MKINKFQPQEVLNKVALLHKGAAGLKGVDMNLSLSKESPESVFGDEGRLMQILNNLIGNAVKFTPPDGKIDLFCKIFSKHFR